MKDGALLSRFTADWRRRIDFPQQFVLMQTSARWRDDWPEYERYPFFLQAEASLPVSRLFDGAQEEKGFVLGWPIDQSGKISSGDLHVPFPISALTIGKLEDFIYSFGGRYVFIILATSIRRLYLDSGGTLAAVFSNVSHIVGSTVSLLALPDKGHPLWSIPTGVFPDDRPDQFYPAGLTPDPHIRRLLPGHYLDLDTWQAVRHFPKGPLEWLSEGEISDAIEEIVRVVRTQIAAVVKAYPQVYLPLTAGRDSRMLLACSKELYDRIQYVTFEYSDRENVRNHRVDVQIANRMARSFNLPHSIVPVSAVPPEDIRLLYLRRIGFSGGSGKSRDFFVACRENLEISGAWGTAFAGEVGRAYYWRATDNNSCTLDPGELLKRMGLPISRDDFLQSVHHWFRELPTDCVATVLDLAYIEFRMGCWASPHFYGAAPFALVFAPLCHRRIFELVLQLPPAYRWDQRLASDIISMAWPELLRLPFNDSTGMRRIGERARWKARSIGRIVARSFLNSHH